MFRRRFRQAVVVAAAVFSSLLAATTAYAGSDPLRDPKPHLEFRSYPPLGCVADGPAAFNSVDWATDSHSFAVSGTAYKCAANPWVEASTLAVYSLAEGEQRVAVRKPDLWVVDQTATSREFREKVIPDRVGVYGVCLLGAGYGRVSCIEVTVTANAALPGGLEARKRVVALTDPLVDVVAPTGYWVWATGEDPIGECGNCL